MYIYLFFNLLYIINANFAFFLLPETPFLNC
jgi:hypothetical protein